MNNRITLYPNCKILEWKNFSVDDLEDYLLTLSNSLSFSQTQYIKHALELSIRVNLDEDELDYNILKSHNYNYLMAQNEDNPTLTGKKVYYFIVDKKWISSNCIEFKLKMDTINTFKDLSISPKTTILRQHKNRWALTGQYGDEAYMPVIDLYSENIQPVLFKKRESTLFQKFTNNSYDENRWYLVYRESTTDGPIKIYLCSDKSLITPTYTKFTGEIKAGGGSNYYHIIDGSETYSGRTNVGASITCTYDEEEYTFTINNSNEVLLFSQDFVIKGYWGDYNSHTGIIRVSSVIAPQRSKHFINFYLTNVNSAKVIVSPAVNPRTNIPQRTWLNITQTDVQGATPDMALYGQDTSRVIDSISNVDLSDPKIVKVVCFPYCPFLCDISLTSDEYIIGHRGELLPAEYKTGHWLYEYQYRDKNEIVENYGMQMCSEDGDYETPYTPLDWQGLSDYGKRISRNKSYEPKLYHSDYYQQKLVYDNFSYIFKLELLKTAQSRALFLNLICSTAISSRFIFQIYAYEEMKQDTEDYSGYIVVARNNEVPLYNSAYLNYLRMGYNFDIKTKNRQLTSNIIGNVLTMAGAVGSFASSVVTNGLGITAGIGLLTAGIGGVYKTISNTAQADQNIAEKLRQSEMQGVSVSGADDIDLLTYYTGGNKIKLVEYKCSEKMEQAMFDLFYYYGYIANIQGVPNTTSRKVFNFVQAEVLFNITPNLPKEIVDDIVAKYKEGITFLHHYTLQVDSSTTTRGWDFEQQYENWETTIQ